MLECQRGGKFREVGSYFLFGKISLIEDLSRDLNKVREEARQTPGAEGLRQGPELAKALR